MGKDIYQAIIDDPNLDEQQKLQFLKELPPPPKAGATAQTGNTSVEQLKAANPEAGTGINTVREGGGFQKGESTGTSMLKDAARYVVPPLVVGAAEMAASPLGPGGIYTAGAAAGGATEAILQELGINRKDPTAIAISAGLPGLGRAGVTAGAWGINKGMHLIPGFNQAARGAFTPEARLLGEKMFSPEVGSQALYAALKQQSGGKARLTQFPALRKSVDEMKGDLENISWEQLNKDLKQAGLENLFTDIEQSLSGAPAQLAKITPSVSGKPMAGTGLPSQMGVVKDAVQPGMTFANAKANIEGMGKMISSASDDKKRGAYKRLYSSMLTDLETMEAPAGTPVELWKQARQAYKTEKTRTLLDDAIEKNISSTEGVPLINADGVLKWLRTNKEFQKRLTEKEYTSLYSEFEQMSKLTGKNPQRIMGVLAGMAVSHSAGGALTGYVASDLLSKALMSEGGRQAVMSVLKKQGPAEYFRRAGSIIGAMLSGLQESASEPTTNPFAGGGESYGTLPKEQRDPTFEPSAPVPFVPPPTPDEIKAKVTKAAKDTKLDPKLFHAVVSTESNYNPNAVSKVGAVGLTQLMPKTAAGLGVNPSVVDENLKGGAIYLQSLVKKYNGDVGKALAAYNAGPGRVDKGGPLPQETQGYVAKIMMKLKGDKHDKERR